MLFRSVSKNGTLKKGTSKKLRDIIVRIVGMGMGKGTFDADSAFQAREAMYNNAQKTVIAATFQYVFEKKDGNNKSTYWKAYAGVAIYVQMYARKRENGILVNSRMYDNVFKCFNLSQFTILPEFNGRALGGIALDRSFQKLEQESGVDYINLLATKPKLYHDIAYKLG